MFLEVWHEKNKDIKLDGAVPVQGTASLKPLSARNLGEVPVLSWQIPSKLKSPRQKDFTKPSHPVPSLCIMLPQIVTFVREIYRFVFFLSFLLSCFLAVLLAFLLSCFLACLLALSLSLWYTYQLEQHEPTVHNGGQWWRMKFWWETSRRRCFEGMRGVRDFWLRLRQAHVEPGSARWTISGASYPSILSRKFASQKNKDRISSVQQSPPTCSHHIVDCDDACHILVALWSLSDSAIPYFLLELLI